MLLYYHGQLLWVTRSSGLPYSQREIRYGAREEGLQSSQIPHQVTYDVVATLKPNFYGSLEAVDCHIHSVRYDMAVNRGTEELQAYSDASSGHLRLCSDADTSK
eukprot:scaffold7368_cov114-Skeletonema_marinoi.AAC.2